MTEGHPREIRSDVISLRHKLREFATEDFNSLALGKKPLKKIIDDIGTLCKPDVIDFLVDENSTQRSQEDFRRISNGVSETHVWVGLNTMPHFSEGFTAVVVDPKGELVAANRIPRSTDDGSESYRLAMSKALMRLFLERMGMPGGLSNPDNFKLMMSYGFIPGVDLFLGEALDENGNVVGTAAVGLSNDYAASLLPDDMPGAATQNFLGGRAEEEFAKLTVRGMKHENMYAIQEPDFFTQLRMSH